MKNEQKVSENEAILAEILIAPSTECLENRFTETTEAANCNGKCKSGGGCIAAW